MGGGGGVWIDFDMLNCRKGLWNSSNKCIELNSVLLLLSRQYCLTFLTILISAKIWMHDLWHKHKTKALVLTNMEVRNEGHLFAWLVRWHRQLLCSWLLWRTRGNWLVLLSQQHDRLPLFPPWRYEQVRQCLLKVYFSLEGYKARITRIQLQ